MPEDDEKAAQIAQFLTGLLAHMGAQAVPSIRKGEENTYEVELLGSTWAASSAAGARPWTPSSRSPTTP